MTNSEETIRTVNKIQSDLCSMKKKLEAGNATKIYDNPSFKCSVCENLFSNKQELKRHVETLHCEIYDCNQCDETFSASWKLENHLQVHGSQKKHTCKECGKVFHFSWRLKKHIKMHENSSKVRKCHYFNNGMHCPYEELGCKFHHEESLKCKYQEKCRYDKCIYRH